MIGLLLWAAEAFARAGGGGGFSGGGGGGGVGGYSGGGGGGGGDAIVQLLIYLVFRVPAIGIPLLILVVIGFIWFQVKRAGVTYDSPRTVVRGAPRPLEPAQLDELLRRDPGFSEVLFLDFARLVFTRAHEERGRKNLGSLDAVVSLPVAEKLMGRKVQAVRDVIIGSAQLRNVRISGEMVRAQVVFLANYTEDTRPMYAEEVWTFERAADTRSPGPEGMQALRCPSCGSALETKPDGSCVSCGSPLTNGRLMWRAVGLEVGRLTHVPDVELRLGGGTEAGTNLPTVRPADFGASQRALVARHPEFDQAAFNRRAVEVFVKVQRAWSDMEPEATRALETDGVFQSHRYWIERYRREDLRNHGEQLRVNSVQPARIQMDAYYTAITLRIFAEMLDWTEKAGKVVSGSKTDPKRFSEYWTFVRAAGKSLTPRQNVEGCPSCGAPLDRVGEGGICGYCEAKITTGDFDWVLAAIDQDDVYGA